MEGQQTHIDVLGFAFTGVIGQKIRLKTDPFFLRPTGDAVLTGMLPTNLRDLYSFRVEETAYKAASLIAGLIIGIGVTTVGAFVTWLLT